MRECIVETYVTETPALDSPGVLKKVEAQFHKFFEGGAIVEYADGRCELVELYKFKFKKYDTEPSYEGPI